MWFICSISADETDGSSKGPNGHKRKVRCPTSACTAPSPWVRPERGPSRHQEARAGVCQPESARSKCHLMQQRLPRVR